MMYFQTKTGSTYYVDATQKLIWGGHLGTSKQKYFDNEPIMVGMRACFKLGNKELKTSTVTHIN